MSKQIWVKCLDEKEERELLKLLKGYKQDIEPNKREFPLVIDTQEKWVIRNTSVSACGIYVSQGNEIITFEQAKKIIGE